MFDVDPHGLIDTVVDGRYRILSFIGSGGMGSVYRAEHVTIRRPIALKFLHPEFARSPEVARRFEREAYATGRIDHPNCVTVQDFGKLADGSLYLVMELLEGQSLADRLLAEGRLAPLRALHILRHVLHGLGHAHRAGIVHRDVKPDNIVLADQDGDPDFAKILDFGIAKLTGSAAEEEGTEHLTRAGLAFGTPAYISPEQAVGEPVDPRADLYSATVVLFEMIAGVPPFQSEDKLELLAMHAARPLPALGEVAGVELPDGLEALVARGAAKHRDERFASAEEYIAAIEEILPEEMRSIAVVTPGGERRPTVPVVYGGKMRTGLTTGAALADRQPVKKTTTAQSLHAALDATMAAPAVQPSRGTGAGEAAGTGPEMAVRRRRRRRFLLVGAASAALLLGAGVVTLSKRPPAPAAPSVPSPSSEPAASIAAQAAEDELKRGDPQAAIALLRAQGATRIADDASAQLQLGHAHAARREYRQATSAYQRALELDPALHGNQELRTNLELMLASDEGTIALGAAEVMLRQLAAPSASERLVALAERHPNASTRRRALELADELGLGERVNRVASFILDLQTSPTCLARKQAVAKLRALGDPAAIPALAQAAKIPPRPKIRKGRKRPPPVRDPYACLHKDARDAMLYLQRLDGRPPAAAPR